MTYLEKKIFFDKKKGIEEIVKDTDTKNVIFMRYNGELYAIKLELAEYFYKKIEGVPNFDMRKRLKSSSRVFRYYFYLELFQGNKT